MTKERALLVVVDDKQARGWPAGEVAKEMERLVMACGGEVAGTMICRMDRPGATYLIGAGKVDEIVGMCSAQPVDTVIFSHDLKGSQQRNLEEMIKIKTIDRTQLILDIFARHAKSQEGKMQVELAQLEYLLPRLVGKGIELSRLGGGIGTVGPGETKLEVDRRRIGERIARLKKDLQDVSADRALKRKKRQEQGVPLVSLVGYTNAGKSTLLNTLTQADQATRDGLFTTLDPLSRQCVLPHNQKIVVSDTVGFMQALPHHLIEAFKATLEEVINADLLLHVLDVSHPQYRSLHQSVMDVLEQLGADDKPMITVLNKIDKLEDVREVEEIRHGFENPVAISARRAENIPALLEKIEEKLSSLMVPVDIKIPLTRMDLVHLAHEQGYVQSIQYGHESIHLQGMVPVNIAAAFHKARKEER